jgi:hypothetical protein
MFELVFMKILKHTIGIKNSLPNNTNIYYDNFLVGFRQKVSNNFSISGL